MFWKKKPKKTQTKPTYLAQSLYDEYVCRAHLPDGIGLEVPPASQTAFLQKVKLYQYAAVLTALLTAEQQNPTFTQVRVHLEALFFPASPSAPGARQSLAAVQAAMQELVTLSKPVEQAQPFTWARGWLEDVGVQEFNPAKLTMFVSAYMAHFESALNTLGQFEVVA